MIALALLLGPLDAARGGQFLPKIGALLYGLAVSLMLTNEPWQILILTIAFILGEASGWGCPLGMALSGKDDNCQREWWQLWREPWTSLAIRGFLWGLPVSIAGTLIGAPQATALPFIMLIAMPLAPALVRASIRWHDAKHLWPMQEWVRGWLIGGMLWMLL